jgi:hypothetical protein
VSGRITTYLDRGLGWTLPIVVACCSDCGTVLARHTKQAIAERTARRTRCPTCGTRAARRLPGTSSPATDLAIARGRWGAAARRGPPATTPHPGCNALEGGEPRARPPLAARC